MDYINEEENTNTYAHLKNSEIIKLSLRETYKDLREKQLREITLQAIFAPDNRKIALAGREIAASDLRYELASNIEERASSRMLKDELKKASHDTSYELAIDIEAINSGTNSNEEFFSWLDDTTDILKNMNDGFVSTDDLDIRNKFLYDTNQREVELMLCLGLLEGSKHPRAEEEAKRLRYKLQKLREMRSSIEITTRNQADVEISRAEYERAVPYFKAFKALQKLPFGYDINHSQKEKLGINHDDDPDLQPDYSYYDAMLNGALDEMLQNDSCISSREYQLAYDMTREQNEELSDKISDKMKKLTGRRNSFRLKYESLDSDNG